MNKLIIFTLFCLFVLRAVAADNSFRVLLDGGGLDDTADAALAAQDKIVLDAAHQANDVANKLGTNGKDGGVIEKTLDPTLGGSRL